MSTTQTPDHQTPQNQTPERRKPEEKDKEPLDLKGVSDLAKELEAVLQVGMDFEVQLKEIQVMTRMSDEEISQIGDSTRTLAEALGSKATVQLKNFGSIIERLGPGIVKDNDAMSSMGNSVTTLSKLMGNDMTGAMDTLTTSMLQFDIDLSDPQTAAAEMARMMNVVAAASSEGGSKVSSTSEALKSAGVAANNANLSFEETNSALQMLAKAGSKGSEAGLDLSNVLDKMGSLSTISGESERRLRQLGINYDIVSDKTLPFTDRLRELQKAQTDSALITEIFGEENGKAAMILIGSIDAQEDMTQKITGTNSAYEGAGIVMDSYSEKMLSLNAWLDNLKIGFTNTAGSIMPFVSGIGTVATTISNVAVAADGMSKMIKMIKSLTIMTHLQTAAQWALNVAMSLNPMTWFLIIIGAVIGALVVCWNKFQGFREVVMGAWEVVKGFGNILKDFVIERIKSILSGLTGIGEALLKLFSGDFSGAWQSAKQGVEDLTNSEATEKAIDNLNSLGDAWKSGVQKGADSWEESMKEKEAGNAISPSQIVSTDKLSAALTPAGRDTAHTKDWEKNAFGNEIKQADFGGGGKSTVMNITNNFSGFKSTKEMAEAVAKEINNRLSDSLTAIG